MNFQSEFPPIYPIVSISSAHASAFSIRKQVEVIICSFRGKAIAVPPLRDAEDLIYLEEEKKEENRPSSRTRSECITEYILPPLSVVVNPNRKAVNDRPYSRPVVEDLLESARFDESRAAFRTTAA